MSRTAVAAVNDRCDLLHSRAGRQGEGGPLSGDRVLRPQDLVPDDLDAPFWEGCKQQVFLVHRCTACGRAYWPASTCLDHGSASMEWQPASGRGEVFTYTVVHHPYHRSLVEKLPYAATVVNDEDRSSTDIVRCALRRASACCVMFEAVDDGKSSPSPRHRPGGARQPDHLVIDQSHRRASSTAPVLLDVEDPPEGVHLGATADPTQIDARSGASRRGQGVNVPVLARRYAGAHSRRFAARRDELVRRPSARQNRAMIASGRRSAWR
jgi:uncharacterized OB-fold protein